MRRDKMLAVEQMSADSAQVALRTGRVALVVAAKPDGGDYVRITPQTSAQRKNGNGTSPATRRFSRRRSAATVGGSGRV